MIIVTSYFCIFLDIWDADLDTSNVDIWYEVISFLDIWNSVNDVWNVRAVVGICHGHFHWWKLLLLRNPILPSDL